MDADASPQQQPRPLILDVDTGIDDMIALLIAATSPELSLRGVTCVAGNVEIHHVARNTGQDPAHGWPRRRAGQHRRGAATPAAAAHRTRHARADGHRLRRAAGRGPPARHDRVHRRSRPAATSAAHVSRHPGEMTIVALGPLTNLGLGTLHGADLRAGAREVIWMGGTLEERGQHDRDRRVECLRRPGGGRDLPAGRRDRPHLSARRDAGHRLHHGRSPPAAGHASGRHRPRRRALLRRLPPARPTASTAAYLHDPVTLIGSLLRPDLVTGSVEETLACDTSSDPYLAGSLFRSETDDRPAVSVATAIDADGSEGGAHRAPRACGRRPVQLGTTAPASEEGQHARSMDRCPRRVRGGRRRWHRLGAGIRTAARRDPVTFAYPTAADVFALILAWPCSSPSPHTSSSSESRPARSRRSHASSRPRTLS